MEKKDTIHVYHQGGVLIRGEKEYVDEGYIDKKINICMTYAQFKNECGASHDHGVLAGLGLGIVLGLIVWFIIANAR